METRVFTRPRRAGILLALLALAAGAVPARADSSIAVDVATGKVLSQNNATERRYPASTTKLMTAYLALKALRDGRAALDTPVVMTRRAAGEAPSKMGFKPGSVMRLDMALRMMLVKSANDVAFAIGQTLGQGSVETFVGQMNGTALDLGMRDTRFVNPNGLPGEGQYSSAKDLAILGVAIRREFPAFNDYFGTEAIATGQSLMKNGNKLLGRYDGADGMKTGYICASGFNLVSSATREGRAIVAVVLGAESTIVRERESAAILEGGFKTDPASISLTVNEMPTSAGAPLDTSEAICSQAGRTARANERVEDAAREDVFGSPFLHEMTRAPATVKVSLGGAGAGEGIEPGVTIIAAYGLPIPTPRPLDLELPYIQAPAFTKPADSSPMAANPAGTVPPVNSLAPMRGSAVPFEGMQPPAATPAEDGTPGPQGASNEETPAARGPGDPYGTGKGPRLGYEGGTADAAR